MLGYHRASGSYTGPDGETGRRSGLKIRRPLQVVGVQVPLWAPDKYLDLIVCARVTFESSGFPIQKSLGVSTSTHPRKRAARRRCSLHSNQMLNRGYAYTTIISSEWHGQTLLSHLASLYPHSTAHGWQQKLDNGEVALDSVTAAGRESLASGQT